MTEEMEKKIVKLYGEEEMTMALIGERFGVSDSHVARILKKHGVNGSKNKGRRYC